MYSIQSGTLASCGCNPNFQCFLGTLFSVHDVEQACSTHSYLPEMRCFFKIALNLFEGVLIIRKMTLKRKEGSIAKAAKKETLPNICPNHGEM